MKNDIQNLMTRRFRIVPYFSRKSTKNYLTKIKVKNLQRIWDNHKDRKRRSMLIAGGITNDFLHPEFTKLNYVELPNEVRFMMEIKTI